ncbi:hypothetical protein H6M51_02300 [Rhizobium sp. AQ_MP]|uniref:hypothetical protein n=1 Tax=Rhizobium sp. AQ_MP TaxID=2761536 RepID=UPI00163A68A6|nr:hypothetical protein [Rhizobium sp. AQ_MP]MBC2771673.1 hypothetical protein [Rhizobium sp. AQ_MP]
MLAALTDFRRAEIANRRLRRAKKPQKNTGWELMCSTQTSRAEANLQSKNLNKSQKYKYLYGAKFKKSTLLQFASKKIFL